MALVLVEFDPGHVIRIPLRTWVGNQIHMIRICRSPECDQCVTVIFLGKTIALIESHAAGTGMFGKVDHRRNTLVRIVAGGEYVGKSIVLSNLDLV